MIYKYQKTDNALPVNLKEVARYAGAKTADGDLKRLIDDCVKELCAANAVDFAACYAFLPLKINGDTADFGDLKLKSKDLIKALSGADGGLIFACTIGIGIDRLIKKYSEISPARSLVFQALGAERIETYIDKFLSDIKSERKIALRARFSPGYGDLSLETQRDIFALLNPQKTVGLTLNDSLLMSPSKSVTAIAGIVNRAEESLKADCKEGDKKGCKTCRKADCAFRE